MTEPHVHAPHASVLGDSVLWCACGWLSSDPAWLHMENADNLMTAPVNDGAGAALQ